MNNNADNKPGVMIYFDIIPLIEGMSPDDAGQLFLAILKYAQYGEIPSITINLDRKAGQPVRLSFHLVPKLQ